LLSGDDSGKLSVDGHNENPNGEMPMNYDTVGVVAATMLEYVERGGTFQGKSVTTVPTTHYTDPARWLSEVELIFKRVPLMLALSAELPKPGDYKAMEAMGLPLLITRDKTGAVHVLLNVCAHRGAPVAAVGHGHCARFSCAYHGWSYGSDGRLLAVTGAATFGDFDKSQRGLRELPSRERAGMIFAVLTPGAPLDIDGYYGELLEDFEAAGLAGWSFLGSRVIEGANWKIAFDGYLEGYHFATLHPASIATRTHSNITHYEAFGPHLRIGFPQRSIGELREVPREQWGHRENAGFDFVRILFPNVSVFLAPELAQIAQLFPGPTPDKNRTVLLYARKTPPQDDADRAGIERMIDFLRDVTHDEDYVLGGRIQKGIESGAHDTLVFGKNERGNQFFHETVEWYLRNDPHAPKPVL
jgi:phenylpropionate dioxygenase-like ring-hydroxylating dioxygenase large terminal subunit